MLTTRQSAKLRRIAKGPCGVYGALCAQAYDAQLEVRMDSMEVEGPSPRVGRADQAAAGPQQPSDQVLLRSFLESLMPNECCQLVMGCFKQNESRVTTNCMHVRICGTCTPSCRKAERACTAAA